MNRAQRDSDHDCEPRPTTENRSAFLQPETRSSRTSGSLPPASRVPVFGPTVVADRRCSECGADLRGKRVDARTCGADACRKAAWRRRAEVEGAVPVGVGELGSELEAWLAGRSDLPEPLVSAARVLARELERAPRSSGLWARYLDVLGRLVEAAADDADEVAALMRRISGSES